MGYDIRSPRHKFYRQAHHAKKRGIEWQLTFDEWWEIWEQSGKWEQRGRLKGQYVMARHGDVGPYAKGNVSICTNTDNIRQAWDGGRMSAPPSALGKGKGWCYVPADRFHPYRVKARGKYIGCYATQAEAEAAYLAACQNTVSA